MSRYFFIYVLMVMLLFLMCEEWRDEKIGQFYEYELSSTYSPLYKYRDFPLTRYTNEDILTNYCIHNFIVSNTNYVDLINTNVCHIYLSNNLWLTDTIFSFTNTNFIYYDSNLKYIVYAENKNEKPIVMDIKSKKVVMTITQGAESIIAKIGYGYSDKLVYGVVNVTNAGIYDIRHFVATMIDINSKSNITYFTNFCMLGFTPDNQYFLYTYYSGVIYYQADYFNWDRLRIMPLGFATIITNNREAFHSYGELAVYDITKGEHIVIGDSIYESSNAEPGWSESIIGVDSELKYFYLINIARIVGWMPNSGEFGIVENIKEIEYWNDRLHYSQLCDDGRYIKDIVGLWKVDISSLGL